MSGWDALGWTLVPVTAIWGLYGLLVSVETALGLWRRLQ